MWTELNEERGRTAYNLVCSSRSGYKGELPSLQPKKTFSLCLTSNLKSLGASNMSTMVEPRLNSPKFSPFFISTPFIESVCVSNLEKFFSKSDSSKFLAFLFVVIPLKNWVKYILEVDIFRLNLIFQKATNFNNHQGFKSYLILSNLFNFEYFLSNFKLKK